MKIQFISLLVFAAVFSISCEDNSPVPDTTSASKFTIDGKE